MVRAAVHTLDHSVGRSPEFVIESARGEPPEHRDRWLFAMQGEDTHVRLAAAPGERLVHRADHVAAVRQGAQGRLQFGRKPPADRRDPLRKAEPLELGGAAEQGGPGLEICAGRTGSKIDEAGVLVGERAQAPVSPVQRSASTSALNAEAISSSDFGPSSNVTRASARPRRPRLMYSRLMTRSSPSSARPRTMTCTCGFSVFQWSTATQSSRVPRSRSASAISSRVKVRRFSSWAPSSGETMKRKWCRSSSQRWAKARSSAASERASNSCASWPSRVTLSRPEIGEMPDQGRGANLRPAVPDHPRLHRNPARGTAKRHGRAPTPAEGGPTAA